MVKECYMMKIKPILVSMVCLAPCFTGAICKAQLMQREEEQPSQQTTGVPVRSQSSNTSSPDQEQGGENPPVTPQASAAASAEEATKYPLLLAIPYTALEHMSEDNFADVVRTCGRSTILTSIQLKRVRGGADRETLPTRLEQLFGANNQTGKLRRITVYIRRDEVAGVMAKFAGKAEHVIRADSNFQNISVTHLAGGKQLHVIVCSVPETPLILHAQ